MPSFQVTIPSTGKTQLSPRGIGFRQLIVQNNSADATVRVGDSTIVAGAYGTGKGLLLVAGANSNQGPIPIQAGVLSDYYAAGAVGTVLDVFYLIA